MLRRNNPYLLTSRSSSSSLPKKSNPILLSSRIYLSSHLQRVVDFWVLEFVQPYWNYPSSTTWWLRGSFNKTSTQCCRVDSCNCRTWDWVELEPWIAGRVAAPFLGVEAMRPQSADYLAVKFHHGHNSHRWYKKVCPWAVTWAVIAQVLVLLKLPLSN